MNREHILFHRWLSHETKGYKERVTSKTEKDNEELEGLQKLLAIKREFPDNPIIQKIVQDRMLETLELTPEESQRVKDFETKTPQTSPLEKLKRSSGELKEMVEANL